MKTIRGKIDGDLNVDDEVCVRGMVAGTITVQTGGQLDLRGMCCTDLIIEPGTVVSGTTH